MRRTVSYDYSAWDHTDSTVVVARQQYSGTNYWLLGNSVVVPTIGHVTSLTGF